MAGNKALTISQLLGATRDFETSLDEPQERRFATPKPPDIRTESQASATTLRSPQDYRGISSYSFTPTPPDNRSRIITPRLHNRRSPWNSESPQATKGDPLSISDPPYFHARNLSPPIASQERATWLAHRWMGIIDVDLDSGSREASEKRQRNRLASKTFRQRKTREEEMQKSIEKLIKQRDYYRSICHQLLEKGHGSSSIEHRLASFKPAMP